METDPVKILIEKLRRHGHGYGGNLRDSLEAAGMLENQQRRIQELEARLRECETGGKGSTGDV